MDPIVEREGWVHDTVLVGLFDHWQRLAVDDADFEGERIESFDATEVDAVLVPEVHAEVAQVVVRREVAGRNVGGDNTAPLRIQREQLQR